MKLMWVSKKMTDFTAGFIVGVVIAGMFGFLIGMISADHVWSKKVAQLCPDCGGRLFYYWSENLFLCASCAFQKDPWFATTSEVRKK